MRKALVVAIFAAIALLLWEARHVIVLVFLSAVLAAGISPAVHKVRVWGRHLLHRNVPRGAAVLLVYFPFLALSVAVDVHDLTVQLPLLIEETIVRPLGHYIPVDAARAALREGIRVPRSSAFLYLKNAASAVTSFVAVFFMVGYMLIDAPRLRNLILLIYPPQVRAERRATLRRIAVRMRSWLSRQIVLSAIIGVATFAGLLSLRIPYALPLAIFAAIGELSPVIGPIVGAAPALAIALLQSRWQFWSVLVLALILQKAETSSSRQA